MGLDLRKLQEKFSRKSGERADRLNLEDGENEIRILPPSMEYFEKDIDYVSYDFLLHYNVGVEGDKRAETCPKTFGRQHRCPICEATWKLYRTNTVEDKELAKDIRAKKKHLFNAISLKNPEKGVQILEVGEMIYKGLALYLTNPKYEDLLDLDSGRNITITKVGKKESSSGYEEYTVVPDPTPTSIRKQLPKDYKDAISLLVKAVPQSKSYDDLKAILEGDSVDDDTSSALPRPAVERVAENESEMESREETGTVDRKLKLPPVPKLPDVPEHPQTSAPELECFGTEYGPKKKDCLVCVERVECRKKFLDGM